MQWYRLLLSAAYGVRRTAHALLRIVNGDDAEKFFVFFVPGDLEL